MPRLLVPLRRALRRHRRPVAAVLAGVAALIALTALRAPVPPPPAGAAASTDPAAVQPGEVAVPVLLASSALASVLRPGDVVDVVTEGERGEALVVASAARVLDRPSAGGGLAPTTGGLVVVAVDADDGAALAVSGSRDELAVVIRARGQAPLP